MVSVAGFLRPVTHAYVTFFPDWELWRGTALWLSHPPQPLAGHRTWHNETEWGGFRRPWALGCCSVPVLHEGLRLHSGGTGTQAVADLFWGDEILEVSIWEGFQEEVCMC